MKRFFPALFVFILLAGLFTRAYQFRERFIYAHDSDLASWIVKDIVVDHHLRLIGQLTSAPGIFIGPLFYYSLIPFYLVTGMDPIGSVAFSWIVGLAAIISIFWVFDKISGYRAGIIAALLYAFSFGISVSEREVVPTTPVGLWSIWLLYALYRLFSGKKDSLIILAVLLSLVWNLNLALGLLFFPAVIGLYINRKKFRPGDFILPVIVLIFLSSPLILFETRHGFQQTRSLFISLSSVGQNTSFSGDPEFKFVHTASYIARNASNLFWWGYSEHLSEYILPVILMTGFAWLLLRGKIPHFYAYIFPVWILSYWLFFSVHPINLSEYYLNGLNIIWLSLAVLLLVQFTRGIPVILCLFIFINLSAFFAYRVPAIGYIQKKELISYISADAKNHGYPCISVSYITAQGYNLGYRYFIYLAGIKTATVASGAPVYSIVFPQSLVDRLDRTFGALGLILPDYGRYNSPTVELACDGPDANLTDPMFGFTR